jgi:hypothetical protein
MINKFPFFLFFILILLVSLVLGVGGGGSSSSSSSSSGSSSSSSSGGGSDGPHLYGLKCSDNGQITFNQKPRTEPVVANFEGIDLVIDGTWKGTIFTSQEGELLEAGEYTVLDQTNGNKSVECEGTVFSCRFAQISLDSCTKSFSATFTIENIDIKDIEITLEIPGKYVNKNKFLKYSKNGISTELKGAIISSSGKNRYEFSADVDKVISVQVSHPKCVGEYYVYSKMQCSDEIVVEETGDDLKCGGYLDIEDRVRCRLRLRKEQANEYENFFPEECKTRENQDECLKCYQDVQVCWDFPRGKERIDCVKRSMGLGDIEYEKEKCDSKNGEEKEHCYHKLKHDGYNLIKFRLYDLEEEAEHFMEEGKLSEDQVVSFVVQMEKNKAFFNQAKSKEERKLIILKSRKGWIDLMKGMRS